jgi:hypothetical protein
MLDPKADVATADFNTVRRVIGFVAIMVLPVHKAVVEARSVVFNVAEFRRSVSFETKHRSHRYEPTELEHLADVGRDDPLMVTGAYAERLVVATLAQRPDLRAKVFAPEIQSAVPEFMRHDPAGALYYGDGHLDRYFEFGLAAFDPDEPDRPVARAFSVPFAFRDDIPGREVLPDGGWDEVIIRWAHRNQVEGRLAPPSAPLKSWWRPHCSGAGYRSSCSVRCAKIRAALASPIFARHCAQPISTASH